LRFPSLSERFFAGTTGRGEVVGNPDLEPERSLNVDVGVRRYGGRTFVAVYLFRNEIDDYVERISLPDGRRTFVNLTSGTIEGVEVEAFWEARPGLRLAVTGHRMAGESAAGEALADVPANRAELSGAWTWGAWAVDGAWQRRVEKDDPGPGEQAIPAADLVSLAASYRIAPGWRLTVAGKNLLDETYFNAADDALPPMPGRSLELGIRWAP
jgi:iron complex outermembrane receptor protein